MIYYKELRINDMREDLLDNFVRTQEVDKVWRKVDGEWHVCSEPFIDDWTQSERNEIIKDLKETIESDGFVYGAFIGKELKGFVSVDSIFIGSELQYIDMTNLHVSCDVRSRGIGKHLFFKAVNFARAKHAKKIYISAHSAVESAQFYINMGCVEALEYSQMHVEKEPYDYQMEYKL